MERAFFAQHFPGNFAESARHHDNSLVGNFAPLNLAPIERSEVAAVSNGHPGSFDKSPAQPFVTLAQQGTVPREVRYHAMAAEAR